MIKHGHTEAKHRFSLPAHSLGSSICQTLFCGHSDLFLFPVLFSSRSTTAWSPPPLSPLVKLCWALQESNEGTANQWGSRCEGAYKITILGSKTIGCVCEGKKKKWIWRNSVEQEQARKESEQRRRKEWEEWEQSDGWGGRLFFFFSLLDKSVSEFLLHSVALPKSCLSNKN